MHQRGAVDDERIGANDVVHAGEVDLVAQLGDPLDRLHEGRCIAAHESDLHRDARLGLGGFQRVRLGQRDAHRLLDQDMLARRHRRDRHLGVVDVRIADEDGVNVGFLDQLLCAGECLDPGKCGGDPGQNRRADVAQRGDTEKVRQFAQGRQVDDLRDFTTTNDSYFDLV